MRRSSLLVVSVLALTACGGGSDSADSTTTPVETQAAVDTEAPADTQPANTQPADTDAPVESVAPAGTEATTPATDATPDASDPAGAVAVSLVEWAVEAPSEIAAGTVTFDVTNAGSFSHHFAIARGDSYATLPQTGGGAIDEAALGDDYLGKTENLPSGGTTTVSFDLAPGNYVFFCNIAGSVSHAAQGQVLSVTVS